MTPLGPDYLRFYPHCGLWLEHNLKSEKTIMLDVIVTMFCVTVVYDYRADVSV